MGAEFTAESRGGEENLSYIGPYQVIKRLGAGGMGEVYQARSRDGDLVAVKRISTKHLQGENEEQFRSRFRREVQAAREFSGSGTPVVVDAEPHAESPWFATVFVEGCDLFSHVKQFGVLKERELRTMVRKLAKTLKMIHKANFVHRDIKPQNILLTANGPLVLDFGIAKPLAPGFTVITEEGFNPGTRDYMSPEQLMGKKVSSASDIYSLGLLLTFAATGKNLSREETVASQVELSGIPDTLRPLVKACLNERPGLRPSADELLKMCADPGTWSWERKVQPPMKKAHQILIFILAYGTVALLGATTVVRQNILFSMTVVTFAPPPLLFLMVRVHAMLRIIVRAKVDGWGVELRYGRKRVEYPWEDLMQVKLVSPARANVPNFSQSSLVAVVHPNRSGVNPKAFHIDPSNHVGLNMNPTAREIEDLQGVLLRRDQILQDTLADSN
ncbi:serine/threonine-protein kinase [Streptomyces sp. DSM 15324]|uniref:serine/threonine-protein kinase n=1 Tax=Streptomyces sp. DSM 15324 TaxID=1739111 RepID=UPI00099E4E58|nr:serine/threonine-protein kinase [Streptomyces sp. DSM 15324]